MAGALVAIGVGGFPGKVFLPAQGVRYTTETNFPKPKEYKHFRNKVRFISPPGLKTSPFPPLPTHQFLRTFLGNVTTISRLGSLPTLTRAMIFFVLVSSTATALALRADT